MGELSQSKGSRTPSGSGSGSTATSTSTSFVAGDDKCEEKTVTLTIKNVAEFLAMSNDDLFENGLTFEAGRCTLRDGTRTRATWKYFFEHFSEEDGFDDGDNWIGQFLTLSIKESRGKAVKSARAWHSVGLSSGGTLIASFGGWESREFVGVGAWGLTKFIKKSELLEKTKETNSLEVTLLVQVFCNQGFKPVAVEIPPPLGAGAEVTEMRGEVNSDLKKMLASGIGADVEVMLPSKTVGGNENMLFSHTKQAHKAILMGRSSVFAKMFAKNSKMAEAQTGVVVIKDLSPKGLDVFLNYLYTGEVLADWIKVYEEVFNIAEQYNCGKLKQFCGHNLKSAVTPANALTLLKFAKKHKLSYAEKEIMEFIHKNSKTVFPNDVLAKAADFLGSE